MALAQQCVTDISLFLAAPGSLTLRLGTFYEERNLPYVAMISLIYLRASNIKNISSCMLIGFTGALLGFVTFQQAFCNTVI